MTNQLYDNLYTLHPEKGLYIHRYIKMDKLLTGRHSKDEIKSRLWYTMDEDMEPLWLEILGTRYQPTGRLLRPWSKDPITKQKLLELVSQFHAVLYKYMTTS